MKEISVIVAFYVPDNFSNESAQRIGHAIANSAERAADQQYALYHEDTPTVGYNTNAAVNGETFIER